MQPGRKSKASGITALEDLNRPPPPCDLNPDEMHVWADVTHALPSDWFGIETTALLTQYCRHVVLARHIARMIAGVIAAGDIKSLRQLTIMQARETGSIASLAVKMRIAQQSTITSKAQKDRVGKKAPWNFGK